MCMKLETKSSSSAGKEFTRSAGDPGSIPRSGKSCGQGIDYPLLFLGFPGGSDSKESACNVGDLGLNPGLERSPGGGHATHSSILAWRIPRDRVAWQVAVSGGCKESDTTKVTNHSTA